MPNKIIKDPGLQLERTQLAWIRTLFLIALVGIFLLRIAFIEKSILLCLAGILLLVLLIVVKLYQYFYPTYFDTQHRRKPHKLLGLVAGTILLANVLVISYYVFS